MRLIALICIVMALFGLGPARASTPERLAFAVCPQAGACPPAARGTTTVLVAPPADRADLTAGWRLLIDMTRFERIRVEVQGTHGAWAIERRGDDLADRWSLGNNFMFAVPLAGPDVRAIRVTFTGSGETLLRSVKAMSFAQHAAYKQRWLTVVALIAGVIGCSLAYNLFLLSWLRESFQRWYVAWLTAALGYTLTWTGAIYYILPELAGFWSVRLQFALIGALVGIGSLFVYALVEREAMGDRVRHIGRVLAYLTIALGLVAATDLVPLSAIDLALNLAFLAATLVMAAGVAQALARGSRSVRFYLVGWLPVLVVFCLRLARNFGLLPQSDAVDLATFVALGFEAIMLSLAIADRFRSISRQYDAAEAEAEILRRTAATDALTGLANRACFQDRLRDLEARGETADLIIVDLDFLKETNDIAGHDAGDRLLRATAARLSEAAGPDAVTARLGGDEFAVLLAGRARDRVDTLLQAIAEPATAPDAVGPTLPMSMSAGHAMWSPADGPIKQLYKNADLALYQAKASGRGTWRTYHQDLRHEEDARRRLVIEAHAGLLRREFELHYQPVVALQGGRLIGHEALLRWHHPVRGLLTPGGFAAVLEEPAVLAALQDRVLDDALAAAARDPALGKIGINMVASQLQGEPGAARILDAIARFGVAPARVVIEVTETVMLGRAGRGSPVFACIDRLRNAGVSVALDDFGTGYASLIHLRTLPTDTLKIDLSLVAELPGDPASARIVRAIVELGHAFGKKIVAEGIETPEQFDCLKQLGCDFGQGHFLGYPVPLERAGAAVIAA